MASVVDVKTKTPVVESVTVKLSRSEAMDVQTYIRNFYEKNGYGKGYEKNVGLFNVLTDGLAGKKTPEYVF